MLRGIATNTKRGCIKVRHVCIDQVTAVGIVGVVIFTISFK